MKKPVQRPKPKPIDNPYAPAVVGGAPPPPPPLPPPPGGGPNPAHNRPVGVELGQERSAARTGDELGGDE